MSYNYTALRSTTPPLYYHRPEGVAPSYQCVPDPKLDSLRVAYPVTSTPQHPSSVNRPAAGAPLVARSSISNPFPSVAPPPSPRESVRSYESIPQYMQQQSYKWSAPAQSTRSAALDAEEAALMAEEMTLKAKVAELRVGRQRREEELLALSRGWATLLEREERYYTEPVADLTHEILEHEQQCAALRDRLSQARSHLQGLQQHAQQYDHVMGERAEVLQEVGRVQDGLTAVEKRRKACILRAERFFDVENKRAMESKRSVRRLENELKQMTASGPLAQLQHSRQSSLAPSRSASRGVSFADKSIVLGPNGEESLDHERETAGLSSTDNTDASADQKCSSYVQGSGNSISILLDDEDMGANSVVYSFNNSKRPRLEVPAM